MKVLLGIVIPVMVLTGGCLNGKAPPASPPPPVIASTTHYMGTPLSGATTDPVPATLPSANAWAVEVTIVSLGRMPGGGGPLSGRATLVTATRGASAVLPSARLTRGARVATLADPAAFATVFGNAGQPTTLLEARGAVPVGATAVFKTAEQLPRDDRGTGRIWRRGVEVDVFRPRTKPDASGIAPPQSIGVALAVDDFAQPDRVDSSADAPAAPAAAPSPQHEVAVVDLPVAPNAQTLAFVVPFRFDGWNGQAVAAIVTVGPGTSDPAHEQAVAKCLADLQVSSAIAAARPRVGPPGGDEGSALRVALAALGIPERRRSAFIYLAGATGASLCGDATLVADDATLARVAGDVLATAYGSPTDEATIGWLLDQTWFLDMGEMLGNAKLPAELSAVLATHAGEVGRHPSSIDEAGKTAHSFADFENLLLAENTIFLEDASPAARARAFDWLQANGKAPGGYAPLDPPRQRREALERAALGLPPATAPATAPATEPTTEPTEATTAPTTEPATEPSATTLPATEPSTEPSATTSPVTQPATEPATQPLTLPAAPTATAPAATQPAVYVPEPGPATVWETLPHKPATLPSVKPATVPATTQPAAFVPAGEPPIVWQTVARKTATAPMTAPVASPAATQPAAYVPEPGPPTVWQIIPRKPAAARIAPSTQPQTTPSQEAPHE